MLISFLSIISLILTTMSANAPASFNFPHEDLTPIEGVPDYLSVIKLKSQLYANSASVHSLRGSGVHGHSVIVLGVQEYNRIANLAHGGNANDWVAPQHPGAAPTYPANATARQIQEIKDQYDRNLAEFKTYQQVEVALKRQLLAAVKNEYVCALADPLYGFSNVTCRQLLEHLETNYGTLDQDALAKNMNNLEAPWEPSETLDGFWQRFTDAQQIAQHGGDPLTPATCMRIARKLLLDSGLFPLDIRDWDKKPAAEKTWDNFKTFFTAANKERVKNTTTGQLGRAFAAATVRGGQGSPSRMSPLTVGTDGSGSSNGEWSYCWSHGYVKNPQHNSKTCTKKAKGHQEDATLGNMMGGNNTIRRARGEKNTYAQLNKPVQRTAPRGPGGGGAANSARIVTGDPDEVTVQTSNSSVTTAAGTGNGQQE